jgi:type IV pilus assembly protein PilN
MLTLPRINLLPWREQARQQQRRIFMLRLFLTTLTGLLLTGVASLALWNQKTTLDAETARLTAENNRLSGTVAALPDARKQLDALQAHAAELDQIARQRSLGPILIDLMGRYTPEDVWLISVKLNGREAQIEAGGRNPLSAWHLARGLEQAPEVDFVRLQQIQTPETGTAEKSVDGVTFRIGLVIKPAIAAPPSIEREAL